MTVTPVNSIEIPSEYVEVCDGWYSGSADLLYAICSTGGLTTGTNRPLDCDTDEKWYLTLWRGLSVDVCRAKMSARVAESEGWDGGEDYDTFVYFEDWVDAVCERLAEEYNLTEWEN